MFFASQNDKVSFYKNSKTMSLMNYLKPQQAQNHNPSETIGCNWCIQSFQYFPALAFCNNNESQNHL